LWAASLTAIVKLDHCNSFVNFELHIFCYSLAIIFLHLKLNIFSYSFAVLFIYSKLNVCSPLDFISTYYYFEKYFSASFIFGHHPNQHLHSATTEHSMHHRNTGSYLVLYLRYAKCMGR
jgi:hypothetical protein